MDIRENRELVSYAGQRLGGQQKEKRIVLIYASVAIGLTALVTVVNYMLGLQISRLGGLGNMGRKTVFSTLQMVLPLAQSVVLLCLDVGYIAAMLRIARGQYVSEQTLRLGFDRFWVLLRVSLFKGFRYFALGFLGVYAGVMIYMVSPLSNQVVELLMPYMANLTVLDSQIVLDEAAYAQLTGAMWPAFLICAVTCAALLLPTIYSYRMVNHVVIDKPGMGALAALRASKQMMRGNRLALLKLDLRLWWYYGATTLAMAVCYGDMLLPMLGVALPGSGDMWYFVFFGIYLALSFGIYYFLRNRAEVVYALAYDAVKPEEKKPEGVVLGNIFQM